MPYKSAFNQQSRTDRYLLLAEAGLLPAATRDFTPDYIASLYPSIGGMNMAAELLTAVAAIIQYNAEQATKTGSDARINMRTLGGIFKPQPEHKIYRQAEMRVARGMYIPANLWSTMRTIYQKICDTTWLTALKTDDAQEWHAITRGIKLILLGCITYPMVGGGDQGGYNPQPHMLTREEHLALVSPFGIAFAAVTDTETSTAPALNRILSMAATSWTRETQ